jgi:hypothetical protein
MATHNIYGNDTGLTPRDQLTEEEAERLVIGAMYKNSDDFNRILNPSRNVILVALDQDGAHLAELDKDKITIEYAAVAFRSNIASIVYIPEHLRVESIRLATKDMLNNPDPTRFNNFVAELSRRIDDNF